MKACLNSPSVNPNLQQFTLSGTGLTAQAVVTAPASFEVSLSSTTGFGTSVSVTPVAGTIPNTTIYARLVVLATAGLRTGNVTITSTGATSKTVAVRGTVYSLPAMVSVSDKIVEHNVATAVIPFVSTTGGNTYNWVNSNTDIGLPANGQGNIPSYVPVNVTPNPISATITVTPVSTGFAFVPWGDEVRVMNTESHELVKTIPVGTTALGVAVSPDGTKVFISNSESNTVSVINVNTLDVVATIAVGAGPTELVVSADGIRVYVLNVIHSTVSVINTASNSVIATIPITAFNPSKLAISPVTNRLYVVAGTSQIAEVNTSTNAQVGTYTIGNAFTLITGIAVDPVLGYVYVSDGGFVQNKVFIFEINGSLSLKGTIATSAGPDGIVISPDGSRAYIAIGDNDVVAIADLNSHTIINSVAAGMGPEWLAISPDGNYVYAQSNFFSGGISVINTVTQQPAGVLDVISSGRSGNFISHGTGCSGTPVTFSITVNPRLPEITVSKLVGIIVGCEGETSADPHLATMQVSGISMRSGITITAQSAFEVSLNKTSGYGVSIVIPSAGTIVPETTVYIRSTASAPAGEIQGILGLTATDAVTKNVTIPAWINATPEVDPVSDQFFQSGTETQTINFIGTATEFSWTNSNPAIGLPASGSGPIFSFLATEGLEIPIEATITVTPKSPSLAYIPLEDIINYPLGVMDLATQEIIWTYGMPDLTHSLAFSPDGKYVYASSLFKINIINTQTRMSEPPIEINGSGGPMAISADGSRLYVGTGNDKVLVINTVTKTVITAIETYDVPLRLALSGDGQKLFVSNHGSNTIEVINTSTNLVSGSITLSGALGQIHFNPDKSILYAAHGSNISLINPATHSVIRTLTTSNASERFAVSPDDRYMLVVPAGMNGVEVIDVATNTIVKSIETGIDPAAVSIARDGQLAYVLNFNSSSMSVIDMATLSVTQTVPLSSRPGYITDFIVNGTGCSGPSTTFKITIGPPPPTISVTKSRGFIETCEGVVSASPEIQKFYVSGIQLESNVVVIAPAHIQVSLSPTNNFASLVSLTPVAEELDSIPVYVRASTLAPAGELLEILEVTSLNAESQYVEVMGLVHAGQGAFEMSDLSFLNGEESTSISFTGGPQTYTWSNTLPGIGLSAGGVGNIPVFTAVNTGTEPITSTISVQAKSAVYAYVPNTAFNNFTLWVVNTETGELVKDIPIPGETWAGAIAQNDDYVYVNSGTLVYIISKTTNSVVSALDVGGIVSGMIMSRNGLKLYGDVNDKGLFVLDTQTNLIIQTTNMCCMGLFGGFALDEENGFIYSSGIAGNETVTIRKTDLTTFELLKFQHFPRIGFPLVPLAVANGKVFVQTGEKQITVLNAELETLAVHNTDAIMNGYMRPDYSGEYVYVSNYFHQFYEINTETNQIERSIGPEEEYHGENFNVSRNLLYTHASSNLAKLTIIDMSTGEVVRQVQIGEDARAYGNFITRSTGCTGAPASFTITVYPEDYPLPEIIVSSAIGTIRTCEGTEPQSPNHRQQFTVSAEDLTTNLTITAPEGFEISLSSSGTFTNTLQLVPTDGTVANTIVYVRIPSVAPAAQRIGSVILTSDGTNAKTVEVEARILVLPELEPATMTTATVGQWYNYFNLMGQQGVTFTATGLPNGLTLGTTGEITGVPTTAVTNYQFQIHADNGSCTKSAQFTITVNRETVAIGISNTSTTYSGTSKSVTVTTSSEVPVTVTYNGSTTLPVNAGTYTVQVTVNSPNHTGSATGSLVINKAQLTVSAQNVTRTFGTNNPTLTLSYSGFVNGETSAGLDQLPEASTIATATSNAGSYEITVAGGIDNNYILARNTGTLTITKADQTITFQPIEDKVVDDAPFQLFASASSTLPITFTVVSGPATVNELIVTLTGEPGLVTIRVSQAGTINYNAVSQDRQFTVTLVTGEDPGYTGSIKIYPNPASAKVVISVPAELMYAQVELVNVQGVIVGSHTFGGQDTLELILDTVARGVYLVRIKSGNVLLTRKLVVR